MNRQGIKNIRGIGGLGVGSEVKDGMGLNTVRVKFTGKVFRVRRIILLTNIILPRVVIPVGIVGLGSGVVVVGIVATVLVR